MGNQRQVRTPVSDEGMRPVGDTPEDPAYRADVQDAVADLVARWGRGVDSEPYAPMPEHTWEQVWAGVQAEQNRGSFGRRRVLPGGRWTTPLVAVSVVTLALVLGTAVLDRTGGNGSSDSSVVASDTAEAPAQSSAPQILQASFVPPAKKVVSLPEEISSNSIADTVDELLAQSGVDEPTDALAMPEESWQPVPGEMTADPQTLRDCITKVTKVDTSQALLVVRAKVNGLDAGLIVVPEFMVDMNKTKDMDADAMRRMGRQMGVTTVYMVEPTCGMGAPDHDPTLMRVAFTMAR